MSDIEKVLQLIKDNDVKFVDLRFTDLKGQEHHVCVPSRIVDEDFFEDGIAFDGSRMKGWRGIEASDMLLLADPKTARLDPFREENTLILTCEVNDPATGKGYDRDPRSIAKRAENFMKSCGIGDTAYFGPEAEFYIFDGVTWGTDMQHNFFKIVSDENGFSNKIEYAGGNLGYRTGLQGGYCPVSPIDQFQEIRAEMAQLLEQQGLTVEVLHHEVGAGQNEIGTRFSTLVERADWSQIVKYTVFNVAAAYGKSATFMAKPMADNAGSGMHVNQSIWKDGQNIFAGNGYAGLSDTALYYIGGIIRHAKALCAITNPTTNSYKRLVPGFEAPVKLAYSASNRSASIRIPHCNNPKGRRVEARFPDGTSNPYLCFAALLMAGLDGIINKIHPGEAADKNLYDLPPEESAKIPSLCETLDEALKALDQDREFLTRGGVFTDDTIDAYIALKHQDVVRLRQTPHPVEFDMYYKL